MKKNIGTKNRNTTLTLSFFRRRRSGLRKTAYESQKTSGSPSSGGALKFVMLGYQDSCAVKSVRHARCLKGRTFRHAVAQLQASLAKETYYS